MVRIILAAILGLLVIVSVASAQEQEKPRSWPTKERAKSSTTKSGTAPDAYTRDSCPGGRVKCNDTCELACN